MNITSFIIICFFGIISFANTQSSYELTCRAKAKEIAAETYRTCVTENKSAEIERLKRDYQERLRNLKDEYEVEVSKLGLKKSKKSVSQKKKTVAPAEADDSQMDLPEPIPVEMENSNSL